MEETPQFSIATRRFLANHAIGSQICVSPLVRLEVLLHPVRNGDIALQKDYEDFIASLYQLSITEEIFNQALLLRAHYRLKTPDALHLATAQYHGCVAIWTNDDRLNKSAGNMAVNIFNW